MSDLLETEDGCDCKSADRSLYKQPSPHSRPRHFVRTNNPKPQNKTFTLDSNAPPVRTARSMKPLVSHWRVIGTFGFRCFLSFTFFLFTVTVTAQIFESQPMFLNATGSSLSIESFESLFADNAQLPGHTTLFLQDFTLSDAAGSRLSVWNTILTPNSVGHPTDGSQYVHNAGTLGTSGNQFFFAFDRSINAFGLNLTDVADSGSLIIRYSDDSGNDIQVASFSGPQDDDGELFFGFISPIPFHSVTLDNSRPVDGWAVDKVQYGTVAVPESKWTFVAFAVVSLLTVCKRASKGERLKLRNWGHMWFIRKV